MKLFEFISVMPTGIALMVKNKNGDTVYNRKVKHGGIFSILEFEIDYIVPLDREWFLIRLK